jgi:importin-4
MFIAEPSDVVRRALVDTMAAIAAQDLHSGNWPQLLPFLNESAHSETVAHRVAAMALFASLAESVPTALSPHFNALQMLFLKGLADHEASVQLGSLEACTALLGMPPTCPSTSLVTTE